MLLVPSLVMLSLGVFGAGFSAPEDQAPHMYFIAADDADQAPRRVAIRRIGDGPDPDADEDTIKWVGPRETEPGGPWLGIQFGPVPRALRAQLGIEKGVGQMVLNIIEGSPADVAGMQQYDVLLEIGGRPASAEIGEFLAAVQGYKPHQSMAVTLLRGGQRITTTVTIGPRPEDLSESKYKYEMDAEELSQGRVLGRSGLLEKDAQGNWTFKGFNLRDLPDVWKAIPNLDDDDFRFMVPFGGPRSGNQVFVQKSKGKTVKIERNKDGRITVTTTVKEDDQTSTTTKTYANEQELEAADPEAHKMLQGGGRFRFRLFGDDDDKFGFAPPDIQMHLREAMKDLPHSWARDLDATTKAGDGRGTARALFMRRPNTTFEVLPDGKIKVITRRGGEELVQEFQDAEALKAAKPDLYRKFERLQSRGDSGPGD